MSAGGQGEKTKSGTHGEQTHWGLTGYPPALGTTLSDLGPLERDGLEAW